MSEQGVDLPPVQVASVASSLVSAIEQEAARRDRGLRIKPARFAGNVILRCPSKLTVGQIAKAGSIRSGWAQAADLITKACAEVILVNPETGDEMSAGCRIDGNLADMFPTITGDDARAIARSVFANDVELMTVGQRLADWTAGKGIEDLSPEEIEDLAGEADAAT